MKKQGLAIIAVGAVGLLITAVSIQAETGLGIKVSGPGVVNDSTLKVGKKVTFELFTTNDTIRTGFTIGMAMKSDNIKRIIHIADSGNGLNLNGDIKGHNGWGDKSVWDMQGLLIKENDWDGNLPDLVGFGGISIKRGYLKDTEGLKKISWDVMIPTEGNLTVDSSWFPPGGEWMFSGSGDDNVIYRPVWHGPYHFKVVK